MGPISPHPSPPAAAGAAASQNGNGASSSKYAPVAPDDGAEPIANGQTYDPSGTNWGRLIQKIVVTASLFVIALAAGNYLVRDVLTSHPAANKNVGASPSGTGGGGGAGQGNLRTSAGPSPNTANTASTATQTAVIPPHTGHKKVLVTGAAGFIASHVAEFLLARGDQVVVVDEMNDYYDVRVKEANLKLLRELEPDETKLAIYRGDVADADFITDVFDKERPKWVCHLAARAGVRYSILDPYVYIHSNIKGTTQLMDLSVKYNITNFVYASSSSVYGGSKSTYFSELENVDHPISPYAATKKSVELMAYTYHHLYGLPTSGLRFFTVYGPRGRPDMAPFIFIDRVSRSLPIKQFGDGTTSRDYTYVDDIVDGVVRAVDRPYGYEVFNLGKGHGTSLKDFIGLVQKYTRKNATIEIMPEQPGDVPYTCADVSKARRLLGYMAKGKGGREPVTFEEGIRRTVEWYNSPGAVIAKDDSDSEGGDDGKQDKKKKDDDKKVKGTVKGKKEEEDEDEGKTKKKEKGKDRSRDMRRFLLSDLDGRGGGGDKRGGGGATDAKDADPYYPHDQGTYYPLY